MNDWIVKNIGLIVVALSPPGREMLKQDERGYFRSIGLFVRNETAEHGNKTVSRGNIQYARFDLRNVGRLYDALNVIPCGLEGMLF